MEGVRPCPYCGGEVEVIKLGKNEDERRQNKPQPYRIQCYRCHAVVARGQKFPIESVSEGEERIRQYDEFIARIWRPRYSNKIKLTDSTKQRDRDAALASRISTDDEIMEIHDIVDPRGHYSRSGMSDFDM